MIKTKTVNVDIEVTESLACDNCGANIPLVFEDPGGTTQQGHDALAIIFTGGYGMYVDPLVQHDLQVLWCKKCADLLCAAFPSIHERLGTKVELK